MPRISVNKLGEYMEANANRRRKIVYDAKFPSNFITTRYAEARPAIKSYFTSGYDENILVEACDQIELIQTITDFQANDKQTSLEVLDIMLDADVPNFNNATVALYDGDNPMYTVNGLDISVNPDLIVTKEVGGITEYGLVKIHISKTYELSIEARRYIALVLKKFSDQNLVTNDNVTNRRTCISYDAFRGSFSECPASFTRRWQTLEAACREIVLLWNDIEE